ncbi:MAG: hypothetical protein PF495_05515, partial [Spirochaetales bacterium]|nr:hypothetical protein [Spirochaetales bacterium]
MRISDRIGSRYYISKKTAVSAALFGILSALCVFLLSCSFEYKSETVEEPAESPDYILNGTVYTISRA